MKKITNVLFATLMAISTQLVAAPVVDQTFLLNSGQMIGVTIKSSTGLTSPVNTQPTTPIVVTIDTVNTTIPATNIIWDTTLSYIVIPLPTVVSCTSNVCVTIPNGAITTTTGAVTGGTFTVTNFSNKNLLTIDYSKTTMNVGWNDGTTTYYNNIPRYTNLAKHMSGWVADPGVTMSKDVNGNILSINGRALSIYGSNTANGIIGYPIGYPFFPIGPYTVITDIADSSSFFLSPTMGQPLVSTVMSRDANSYCVSLMLQTKQPVKNLRVYPPGVDWSKKWNPDFIDKIGDASVIRFMDTWETNTPGLTTLSDVRKLTDISYAGPKTPSIIGTVASIDNWPNSQSFFWKNAGWNTLLVKTSQPHGLSTGMRITLSNFPQKLTMSDGSLTSINNYGNIVYVIDATSFGTCIYTGSAPGVTYTPMVTTGTFTFVSCATTPLEDLVDLCNTTNSDMWFNIPILFTDSACSSAFTYIQANLNPGLKLYVEYANEHWNYANSFNTFWYCRGMGAIDTPPIGQTQWYTKRSAQIHNLAAPILGNRLVRLFGSFYDNTSITSAICTYAQNSNIQVDAIAVAPYFSNQPTSSHNAVINDTLSQSQMMDLAELYVYSGTPTSSCVTHKSIMQSMFPNGKLVCYEGGPENGALSTINQDPVKRSQSYARNPRMGQAIYPIFLWRLQEGGVDTFVDYTCIYPQTISVWGRNVSANQKRGIGDGSDGLFDNRTDPFNLDKIVSVIGYAHKKWFDSVKYNQAHPVIIPPVVPIVPVGPVVPITPAPPATPSSDSLDYFRNGEALRRLPGQ